MAPDHLPEITRWEVHVIGQSGGGKVSGAAVFPELEPWTFLFEARPVRGRLVLTRLVVELDPLSGDYPSSGISSDVLGRLRVGALLSAIHAQASESRGHLDDSQRANARTLLAGLDQRLVHDARSVLDQLADDSRPARRGNPGFPATYLRRVAEVRLDVQAEGLRPINAAVADRLGLASPDLARDHVSKATRAGWLSSGDAGKEARAAGPLLIAARAAESEADFRTEASDDD